MTAVRRRQLRAQPAIGLALVGVPLLLAGYGVLIGGPAAPGAALAVVGLVWWIAVRRRPGRWPADGFYCGLLGSLAVLLAFVGSTASPAALALAVVVPVACWLLGSLASRLLTSPVLAELAASRIEWSIPLRGLSRTVLVIGTDALAVRQQARPLLELLDVEGARGTRYPLSAVSWVRDATSTGVAPAQLPRAIATATHSFTGGAVGLRVDGHDWVLPVDDAAQVVALLQRRL